MKKQEHHVHDEKCSCNKSHSHNHHHENYEVDFAKNRENGLKVAVSMHEDAVVATYICHLEFRDNNNIFVTEAIAKIGRGVKDHGGIIGHIKASVEYVGGGFQLSLTDDTVNKKEIPAADLKVEGVAIVFGLLPNVLEQIVIKALTI